MNTPISFPIAELLKKEGFNRSGYLQDVWLGNKYEWVGKGKNKKSISIPVFGLGSSSILPTIADVIMWLYEKYGIWIYTVKDYDMPKFNYAIQRPHIYSVLSHLHNDFSSPKEAYETAIEYTLKNLI